MSALRVEKGWGCDWKLVSKTPHLTRSSKGDPRNKGPTEASRAGNSREGEACRRQGRARSTAGKMARHRVGDLQSQGASPILGKRGGQAWGQPGLRDGKMGRRQPQELREEEVDEEQVR